jgi:hypothetical protein
VAGAAAVAIALSGCSSEPDFDGPYAAEFAAAYERATTDFEREVLADGAITALQYEEAHQRWLACMRDLYPRSGDISPALERDEHGIYSYTVGAAPGLLDDELDADIDNAMVRCYEGTVDLIATLYNDVTRNPENKTPSEAALECLHGRSLVPDGYSEDNLMADIVADIPGAIPTTGPIPEPEIPEPDESGSVAVEHPSYYNPDHVTDLDMTDPAVEECILDPFAAHLDS